MGKRYNPLAPPETLDLGNGKYLVVNSSKQLFLYQYTKQPKDITERLVLYTEQETVQLLTPTACVITIYGPGSEYHQLDGYDHGFKPNPQKAVDIAVDYLKRILVEGK